MKTYPCFACEAPTPAIYCDNCRPMSRISLARKYLYERLALLARSFTSCLHACGQECPGWAKQQELADLLKALEATE